MSLLNDKNGKISSKRTIGSLGFVTGLVMALLLFVVDTDRISDTLIIGVLTASAGLLASTLGEKTNR